MLFISLIVSALLLLIANWFTRQSQHATTKILSSCAVFLVAPFFLMCVLPPVAIQALLLSGATLFWRATHRGYSFFIPLSCGATLVAYGLSGILVVQSEREYARLRALYPYESMEGRLPPRQAAPEATTLPPAAVQRLVRLEERLPEHANGFAKYQLEKLHEHTVGLFINSPGFGVARMFLPTEWSLASGLRKGPVPLQPGYRFGSIWSPTEHERLPAADEAPLYDMHENGILDFVNYPGFGYFKDRQHVSGFQGHEFSQIPAPVKRWNLQTLELVSLLLHDEPAVYVSSELPRMDRLHNLPTRLLDGFEGFALYQLFQGEDLYTSQGKEGVRMLGAIRSTGQCVACHGCERGDLLGAFSYTLRADGF